MVRDQIEAALVKALPRCRVSLRVLFEPVRYGVWVCHHRGEEAAQGVISDVRLATGIPLAVDNFLVVLAEAAPGLVAL